jgi:hypothetical protein
VLVAYHIYAGSDGRVPEIPGGPKVAVHSAQRKDEPQSRIGLLSFESWHRCHVD